MSTNIFNIIYSSSDQGKQSIQDIIVEVNGQKLHMLGEQGATRELAFLQSALEQMPEHCLPVLIGSGTGYALQHLINHFVAKKGTDFPLLIIDKEKEIIEASEVKKCTENFPSICWVTEKKSEKALEVLGTWQNAHGLLPLYPIVNSFYTRLDKTYYNPIKAACNASKAANLFDKTSYSKFKGDKPRVLLMTTEYFLIGELQAALERMGVPHFLLVTAEKKVTSSTFVKQLLESIVDFKPDFALTINHLGIDREGVLMSLFEKIKLPLASWFVDNPLHIISYFPNIISHWASIFTWDKDNIPPLLDMGLEHVKYLPLGTDHIRFSPIKGAKNNAWISDISFVANSLVYNTLNLQRKSSIPQEFLDAGKIIGKAFAESKELFMDTFLERNFTDLYTSYEKLERAEPKLETLTYLTLEASLYYRYTCLKATFKHNPLIVGDDGWFRLIPEDVQWRYLQAINYYKDLANFYPCSSINFNSTSTQMKGAVNQRVFDVPASGSFLLTDYRVQVEDLFEPGKEIICYNSPEEAEELIDRYLSFPSERDQVIKAARKRVIACHTYDQRVQEIIDTMRSIYA